jgi:SOS-response transcriptional repressor LexA
MTELTPRQAEILEFIRDSIARNHYAPTIREIMAHVGLATPNGVVCHLKALAKKGCIELPDDRSSRSIRVAGQPPPRLRMAPLARLASLSRVQWRLYLYLAASSPPPTVREIAAYMGWASPNAAQNHVNRLERMGLVRRRPGLNRTITVVG